MTDRAQPIFAGPPATWTAAVQTAKGRRVIGARLKKILDAMVWSGADWRDAAKAESFDLRALRRALDKAHVKLYLTGQRQAVRAALSSKNEHVAAEIRDKEDGNQMARHGALRYLDGEPDGEGRGGVNVNVGVAVQAMPGYLIRADRYDPADIARAMREAGSVASIPAVDITPTQEPGSTS